MPGTHILTACKEAVEMAKNKVCKVTFDFNEITLNATPETDAKNLAEYYSAECELRRAKYVASPEYSAQQEESARKESERKAKSDAILAHAPANMTLRDAECWRKACAANKYGYVGAIMTYAERWARMMEGRIAQGEAIPAIADECSHLADEEGVTGFMYGCAVSTLAKVWVHGETLRVWHNLKTQLGNEGEKANASGGVLNQGCLNTR